MANLLVVDDELGLCKLFKTALTEAGHSVQTCQNGIEAIDLFRGKPVDLVFCDLRLPGVDGLVVLEAIKAIDPWATVIMVSAYGTVEMATRALKLGAYDFIEKPCTLIQIQRAASEALAHRHQVKEWAALQGKPGTSADIPTRLMELEQLKADFTTMMLRELRVPLRQLDEALRLAREGFYGPWEGSSKNQFLNQILRVETLLSRLFVAGFAFFLNHEHKVDATLGDVGALAGEVLEDARLRCQERKLSLDTVIPSLRGHTDMEKVAYILRELLDNAIRFTPAGGSIAVKLSSFKDGFRLQVADTGCGIKPEDQFKLFSAFRQSSADQLLRKQKSALGLPLVRHYVDWLRGTITLESSPGKGSEFTVQIPWWKPDSEPVSQPPVAHARF